MVPWPEGEAFRVAKACFQAWLIARGGAGAAEDAQAIERAREFFARHGASRFERLVDDPEATPQDQRTVDRAGYVRRADEGLEFLVFPSIWRNEIFEGMDADRATRMLSDANFVVPEKGGRHYSQSVPIRGRARARYYVVRDAILNDDD